MIVRLMAESVEAVRVSVFVIAATGCWYAWSLGRD